MNRLKITTLFVSVLVTTLFMCVTTSAEVSTSTLADASDKTITIDSSSTETTSSTSTVITSSTPNTLQKAKSTTVDSTITFQGNYLGSINFTNGYCFDIREDGAYVTKIPLTNATVVIPDSVDFNGKNYPVNTDYVWYTTKGSGCVSTVVYPPTINFINYDVYSQFSTLKSLVYTSSKQPSFNYSEKYYYDLLTSKGILTTGNYSNYTKDTLEQPKVDSVINMSDKFNLGSIVVGECEYELYSGGYASVKNFSYSTTSYHVNDSVDFNGVTFKVVQLEDNAFNDNSNVSTIYLPDSIKYYLGNPFKHLSNLKHVYCETSNGLPSATIIPSLFYKCGTSTIEPLRVVSTSTSSVTGTKDSSNLLQIISFLIMSFVTLLLSIKLWGEHKYE